MKKLNRIKDVLNEQGRTQTWLAEKLGKTKNSINVICSNVSQPSLSTIYEIADLLGCDVCDLLVREQDGTPVPPTSEK